MTVLHLWHSRGWRGGENQFRLLAGHLAEPWRGHLCAPHGSELGRRLGSALPFHPVSCGGFLDLVSLAKLQRLIGLRGFKLVHAHDSPALSTALMVRLLANVPVVASRRNAFPVSSRWKYRAADAFVAVSEAAAQALCRAGVPRERIIVVPDAVDDDALAAASPERAGAKPGETVVLCVAAFSAEKDHLTLVEAWAAVEAASPDAWLHLAGSGVLEGEVRRRAADLNLRRVRFLGWREDVPALMKGADLVVLSSTEEGLGSSLCEAQAAGKPVVATSAGGIAEAVRDGVTGLLSPPGDAPALAANLMLLLNDRQRRDVMGHAGAEWARARFAAAGVARAHELLYASLISA